MTSQGYDAGNCGGNGQLDYRPGRLIESQVVPVKRGLDRAQVGDRSDCYPAEIKAEWQLHQPPFADAGARVDNTEGPVNKDQGHEEHDHQHQRRHQPFQVPGEYPERVCRTTDPERQADACQRLVPVLCRQCLVDDEYRQSEVDQTPDRERETGRREQRRILVRNLANCVAGDWQNVRVCVDSNDDYECNYIAAPVGEFSGHSHSSAGEVRWRQGV
jgi:hypothetical protein